MSEHHLLIFLLQVLVLLTLARSAGELLRRWGHAPIVGEILVGILLGPTLLGRAAPQLQQLLFPEDPIQQSMLAVVAWFGVLFLLLETGLEVDVTAAWRQRGPALRIGVIGVLVPLIVGTGLSFMLPDRYLADPDQRLIFALFLGTTMAISAMVIIARVLHDLDLVKSDLGLVTLCGYAVNDLLAWVIFSLVVGAATRASLDWTTVLLLLASSVAFSVLSLTLGPRYVGTAIARLHSGLPERPGAILTFVCCLGLACGALTNWLGLTALFGFFLAGIMAGEAPALTERTRSIISQMVHAIFVPLYFAGLGLRLDFLGNFDLFLVFFVTIVSIVTKFGGAWLGALGKEISPEDRLSIGIAFTPSGVTGIVVASVALEYQIISTPVFVAIVFSAIISALMVAPWLSWSIRRRAPLDLLQYLPPEAVISELNSTDRFGVIEKLCEVASDAGGISAETLVSEVSERERLMGTATGGGVAIPHARIKSLQTPMLTFGRASGGVDWNAPDGQPVHFVFLVLTPERQEGVQLQILAAIARGMTAEGKEQLGGAADANELWSILQSTLSAQLGDSSTSDTALHNN